MMKLRKKQCCQGPSGTPAQEEVDCSHMLRLLFFFSLSVRTPLNSENPARRTKLCQYERASNLHVGCKAILFPATKTDTKEIKRYPRLQHTCTMTWS